MVSRVLALIVSVGMVACGGTDEGDPPPTGPITYTVSAYDYAFDMDTRAAGAAVIVQVVEAGDCLTIPLRAESLADVRMDGEPIVSGGLDAGVLTACGAGWEVGAEVELSATVVIPETTWLDSQVGYSTWLDAEDSPFTYLVSWIGGCDRFGPCDNQSNQFATYRFTVDHADDTVVTCPGTITATPTQTVCEFNFPGGPTYSTFGVAMSRTWTIEDIGTWGDSVAVSFYDSPSTGARGRFNAPVHKQFFEWMETTFGAYPYGDELRFIIAPTYWGGFEHPGNIVLADALSPDGQRNTLHHELVHMWAGNKTTLADTYDFVWKEAIANYLPFVFLDEQLDSASALAMARGWRTRSQSSNYHLVPGEEPPLIDYYGDVYSPGPFILFRQLEALFDRDKIIAALQDFLGSTRAASVDDLRLALETATGADLANYFNAWVYGTGDPVRPRFSVAVTDQGGGNVDLTIDEVDVGEPLHGCAFTVTLTGDGGETLDVWVDRGVDGMASTTNTVAPGFAVTGHVFDPDAQCVGLELLASPRIAPPRINEFLAPVPPRAW